MYGFTRIVVFTDVFLLLPYPYFGKIFPKVYWSGSHKNRWLPLDVFWNIVWLWGPFFVEKTRQWQCSDFVWIHQLPCFHCWFQVGFNMVLGMSRLIIKTSTADVSFFKYIYIYIWYPPPKKNLHFLILYRYLQWFLHFWRPFFFRHFFAGFGGGVYKRL